MSNTQSIALAPSSTLKRGCEGCNRTHAELNASGMCEICADGVAQYLAGRAEGARLQLESCLEQTLQWLPQQDVLDTFQRALDRG